MDLFKDLRRIQKKERDNGTLAHVDENFYSMIHEYLNELKQSAIDNPFSDVYNTLNEARRIATEICERREHKITSAAVLNMNRSYQLFAGKQEFDLIDSMPLNLTPEEETFYFSLIETLKNHRINLSGQEIPKESPDVIDDDGEDEAPETEETTANSLADIADAAIEKASESESSNSLGNIADAAIESNFETNEKDSPKDEVLDRIDEVSKAKVIDNEVREPIEKQISKPKKAETKVPEEFGDIEIIDSNDQFIDLEDVKRTRESEITTILVLDEIGSIVGVDEKFYGPFRPQDIVVMPKINANIFVKNRKARFVKI